MNPEYIVPKVEKTPKLYSGWNGSGWGSVNAIKITHFLDSSKLKTSRHKPETFVKCVYDNQGLYILFKVVDKYVKCVNTEFQSNTCDDTCVEFFTQPKPYGNEEQSGYFNIEINCGGIVKCRYNRITKNCPEKSNQEITLDDLGKLKVYHSLPETIDPEVKKETVWYLGLYTPFKFYEPYVGLIGNVAGRKWRANFFKCGNKTSHPHYGSWSPLTSSNFHKVSCFGTIMYKI